MNFRDLDSIRFWRHLARLWFGVAVPVSRRAYILTGLFLVVVKYLGEAWVAWSVTGAWLAPWEFLSPLGSQRLEILRAAPDWVGPAFYVWTAPFLWIALSMSVRRSVDSGSSPWIGLGVLIPILNFLVILAMCAAPSGPVPPDRPGHEPVAHPYIWKLLALLFGPAYTLFMVGTAVYVLEDYGWILFFGGPVMICAVSACMTLLAKPDQRGYAFGMAMLTLLASGLTLLLLALEGILCLAMAAPLAAGAGALGAGIGIVIAQALRSQGIGRGGFGAIALLPLLALAESRFEPPAIRPVTTSVIIDAPPEAVWRHVIDFSRITEEPAWFFRAGIACPTDATIEGRGVGAIRHCQFTTGEFIEPITVWNEPRRLAFNVASQPHPMAEVNPFGDPHPPHLDSALVSQQGEFCLERLADGDTRLVGTTWYRLRMRPQVYWRIWTDAIIHRIHARVLRHVKRLAEHRSDADGPAVTRPDHLVR